MPYLYHLPFCCHFSPPGPDYIKQRFQEGVDAKENLEEKVPEKPPSPKESPHFYRKGTTPPSTPETHPRQSHSPQPSPQPVRKQNPSSGARLNRDKRSVADEQVMAVVSKPLMSKAPSKEMGAAMPPSKYSGRHHVPNPSNGELHSQYHGYYVKLNAPKHPPEDVREGEGSGHSSSALVHKPTPNKWSPPKSVTKPVAKESKAEPKAKKSELAIPKNPASNDACPPSEKEADSVSCLRCVFPSSPHSGSFGEQYGVTCTLMAARLAKVLPHTGLFRVDLSSCVAGDRKSFLDRNSSMFSHPPTHLRHPSGR